MTFFVNILFEPAVHALKAVDLKSNHCEYKMGLIFDYSYVIEVDILYFRSLIKK